MNEEERRALKRFFKTFPPHIFKHKMMALCPSSVKPEDAGNLSRDAIADKALLTSGWSSSIDKMIAMAESSEPDSDSSGFKDMS